MAIKARLKDNVLKIYLPIGEPKVSGSGKTLVIASTRGPAVTKIQHEGQNVIVNANAYIKNTKTAKAKSKHSRRAQEALGDWTPD